MMRGHMIREMFYTRVQWMQQSTPNTAHTMLTLLLCHLEIMEKALSVRPPRAISERPLASSHRSFSQIQRFDRFWTAHFISQRSIG